MFLNSSVIISVFVLVLLSNVFYSLSGKLTIPTGHVLSRTFSFSFQFVIRHIEIATCIILFIEIRDGYKHVKCHIYSIIIYTIISYILFINF